MGYFRPTFYYPVSDSFKDWNRLVLSGSTPLANYSVGGPLPCLHAPLVVASRALHPWCVWISLSYFHSLAGELANPPYRSSEVYDDETCKLVEFWAWRHNSESYHRQTSTELTEL